MLGRLILISWLLAASAVLQAAPPAKIAIIIDDVGNNLVRGRRALELPGTYTYSVLPFATYSDHLVRDAGRMQKELMLHLPMANINNKPLGPGGLSESMSQAQFLYRVSEALARVPGARGINNHMGSALTTREREMSWLMSSLKHQGLFFIDSRTTTLTVAADMARQARLSSASRDVFLDNEQQHDAIDRSFQKLLKIARQKGSAIGIGHPYTATLEYLEQAIPRLDSSQYQMVTVSELLNNRHELPATQAAE